MTVLHIGKYFEPFKGGVETYLRDLVSGLQAEGVASAVLVHAHRPSLRSVEDRFEGAGGAWAVYRVATWFRLLFTPISPAFPFALRRMLRRHRPSLVHVHLPNPSALWVLAVPAARRLPLVVHWHADVVTASLGIAMRLAWRLYRPLERALLRRAAVVIATSQSYLETSDSLRECPGRCRVIPLGLDPGRMRALAAPVPPRASRAGALQVLAVGRLTYYKGFGYLLEAAARTPGVEVHLVGEGECGWELRQLAEHLGLAQRVQFHGALDDAALAARFQACDCLCLPSVERTEAFGLVLLEAMFHARATLVSDVPGSGMGTVLVDGETGLKVPPRDSAALAAALARLRDAPALCAQLGEAGRQRFDARFTIAHGARAVAACYADVVRGATP